MAYKRISPIIVIEGGTGAQTLTSNGVLLGNGISAITATSAGTTGQVLTGVTGSAPTFQSPALSSITITGNTGGGLTGTSFTFSGGTTGLSFGGSGTTETLTFAGITANGGTVSLATDATTSTINIGTGAGVKSTTLGSTNTTSSTAIKSGTGNVAINSGLTVDSTGRMKNTVQPAFTVALVNDSNNVTGDGTLFTIPFDSKYFDQGTNFTTGASAHFAVPYSGIYLFTYNIILSGLLVSHTSCVIELVDSAAGATFVITTCNPFATVVAATGAANFTGTFIYNPVSPTNISLKVSVSGGTKVVDVISSQSGAQLGSVFSGICLC